MDCSAILFLYSSISESGLLPEIPQLYTLICLLWKDLLVVNLFCNRTGNVESFGAPSPSMKESPKKQYCKS